jgi:U3 small nucleolar RNA-associated protein 4
MLGAELEVLKGSLSPWSRRNPTAQVPKDFRKIRDHVRGCTWDEIGSKERIWIYSVGWLWIFDLSRDFPNGEIRSEVSSKKRKRGLRILPARDR